MGISNTIPPSRLIQPGVCTSSNRPTTPFEGQMIYETDTDMLAIWNGTAWRYIASTTTTNGSILQVVSTSDATNRTTSGDYPQLTSLNVSITPKSATSQIFIMASLSTHVDSNGSNQNRIGIYGISYGASSTTSIYRTRSSMILASAGNDWFLPQSMTLLHSPATTSACVYNILFGRYSSTYNNTVGINGDNGSGNGRSTITAFEISA